MEYIDGFILNYPIYNNYFTKGNNMSSNIHFRKNKPKPIYKSSSVKNNNINNNLKYTFLTSI